MKQKLFKFICGIGAIIAPILLLFMLIHIVYEAAPAFLEIGFGLIAPGRWQPLASQPSYSLLPAITGTLYVSALAVVMAVPIGVGCAIFLSLYTKSRFAHASLVLIDMLAGVPSVIFGFIGLVLLVKQMERIFSMSSGECILTAALLLAVMLFPYIVSNCWESIEASKKRWLPTAAALGFSKEYTTRKILLPGIRLGITSSVMMAFGRALGETMAVMMVIGNSPILPKLMGRSITVAGLTALEIGGAEYGSLHMSAIYAANLILLVLLVSILSVAYLLKRRMRALL